MLSRMKLASSGIFVFVLFCLVVWIPVLGAFRSYCFNNYDLGIYAQALARLSPSSPNPWLSVLDLSLFNDHFDPILFLLLPFKDLADPAAVLIHSEMIIVFAATLPFFLLARSGDLSRREALFAVLFFLFNPATLNALYYPAHPGTWALLPLSWTCYFIVRGSMRSALFAFFCVLLCKEEYPIVGLAIAGALWWRSQRRAALAFAALSLGWGLIAFGLRPLLLGPTKQYAHSFISAQGILSANSESNGWDLLIRIACMALPLLPFLPGRRRQMESKLDIHLAIVAMGLALFAIRFVGGWWFNHRSAPLIPALIFVALPLIRLRPECSRRRWALAFLLLFGVAIVPAEKALLSYGGRPFKKFCPSTAGRLAALDQGTHMLLTLPPGPALVAGHLLPAVVARPDVSHLGLTRVTDAEARYLLLEKDPLGDPWPLKRADVRATLERWRSSRATHVLYEDDHVVLLEKTPLPMLGSQGGKAAL